MFSAVFLCMYFELNDFNYKIHLFKNIKIVISTQNLVSFLKIKKGGTMIDSLRNIITDVLLAVNI